MDDSCKCISRCCAWFLAGVFSLPLYAAQLWLEADQTGLVADDTVTVSVYLNAANPDNHGIVVVDAVLQYETAMLEFLSVDTDATHSDFNYSYALANQQFPITKQNSGAVHSLAQAVVGVPGAQAISFNQAQALVAQFRFRVKALPPLRIDNSTTIALVFDGSNDYTQSKVIANDGLGTNVLTRATGITVSTGPVMQVPLPRWVYWALPLLLLGSLKLSGFMPRKSARYGVSVATLTPVLLLLPNFVDAQTNNSYDLTGDGVIDSHDIGVLLTHWNTSHPAADFDNNGDVGNNDLDLLLGAFNPATTPAPPVPRSTNTLTRYGYTYYDQSKVKMATKTVNGPRTDLVGVDDITTTAFDTKNNISGITNALGNITQMGSYNARGQVGQIIDANGVITTLSYHPRGWLLSRTVEHPVDVNLNATTHFGYDAIGQLTQITLPDNSYLRYQYDDARRLVAIENTLAERIEYTLDNAGNRIAEVICAANTGGATGNACNIQRSQTRVFDALSRLRKDIGAQSQTNRFDYDKNDNLHTLTDAKTQPTGQRYDALNRLIEQIDPDNTPADNSDNPRVQYTYDHSDRITSVTDQRGLVTRYTYDAFDSLTSTNSPDTGLTAYTSDDAGNRTSQTDANGQVVYYRYDALNRLTEVIALNAPSENVSYVYDDISNGNYGIGRLSHIYDESGKTSYIYDHRGNVIQKDVQINGVNYNTQYAYTLADRLMQMTYPSGIQVNYSRDADGRITDVAVNGDALVNNINYRPFGSVASYEYANGIGRNITYDMDYRITDMVDSGTGSTLELNYGYDPNSNITQLNDDVNAANDQAFNYDERNRLATANGSYGVLDYDNDAVGNRIQKKHIENGTTTTDTYIYPLDSNRLNQIDRDNGITQSSRQLSYSDAGNTVSDTRFNGDIMSLIYNALDRYEQLAINDNQQATYTYNALGQRVAKTTPNKTIHYHYDESGQLIAQSDETGAIIKQYVYADNLRLGRVDASGDVYYYHNDHLGRPLALTDNNQTVVWKANYLPFGEPRIVVNFLPDQELGFPGQVLDDESGFWYNYFRDYDPATGRYLQSDPIGLRGGLNTYAYVGGNPLRWIDPYGLACSCSFDSSTSKQDKYTEKWYGQEREVTATYQCEDTEVEGSKEPVEGTHQEWYMHDQSNDNGREGNPLGTTYKEEGTYNSYSGGYTYDQTGYESFDPKNKNSSQLNEWAGSCGC